MRSQQGVVNGLFKDIMILPMEQINKPVQNSPIELVPVY